MAAHSFIRLGDEYFFAYREDFSPELAAVFRDEEVQGYEYVTSVQQMRERLDVLGYQASTGREKLNDVKAELEKAEGEPVESFDAWLEDLIKSVKGEGPGPATDVPHWVGWSLDPRFVLRLVLEEAPADLEVALELTEVVSRGYVAYGADFCAKAFDAQHGIGSVFGPLIVMTEGRTDAEFLDQALRILRPHLVSYVRFLDYEFRPEGSTSSLVRAVKAFAAAGIANRVIALFDRDAAAAEALTMLPKHLPNNFRIRQLPESNVATHYPTIGPTGQSSVNVNGLAVSIEMFFGEDILRGTNLEFAPVQWRGYMAKVSAYQGELMDKPDLQKKFRAKASSAIQRGTTRADEDWTGMQAVLEVITTAFHAPS